MKNNDLLLKKYLSNNERFSDIVNYLLYDGKEIVKENDLKELDTTFVNSKNDIFEKHRDILKEVCIKNDDKNVYILFGIENQMKEDKRMISRVLLYDALAYKYQYDNRKEFKEIKPVITLVIYFGTKKWKTPKTLHEMFKAKYSNILQFIPNYHINLVESYLMSDEELNKFKSPFKYVCEFLKSSNTKDGMIRIKENQEFSSIDIETARLIKELTDLKIEIDESEDYADMCKGMDLLLQDTRNEGRQAGILEGKQAEQQSNIKTMNKNGFDEETIAKALSLDVNYVKEVLNNN